MQTERWLGGLALQMNKWISIDDRLPSNDDKVIFYRKDHNHDEVECGSFEYHWNTSNVKWWMPLPEKPNVKQVDNE